MGLSWKVYCASVAVAACLVGIALFTPLRRRMLRSATSIYLTSWALAAGVLCLVYLLRPLRKVLGLPLYLLSIVLGTVLPISSSTAVALSFALVSAALGSLLYLALRKR